MGSRTLTVVLAVCLLGATVAAFSQALAYRLPGNHQGYEPDQPIAFSHRLHAGTLAVSCLYCHFAADKSRYAGIPAASICMNCHRAITASSAATKDEAARAVTEKREPRSLISPEIRKIYDHLGLGDDRERDPDKRTQVISWTRVYSVPDFVYFDHRAHVGAGVGCQHCHGPVETMDRIRQHGDLSMGWCVNCHRDATQSGVNGHPAHASIDCSACHR